MAQNNIDRLLVLLRQASTGAVITHEALLQLDLKDLSPEREKLVNKAWHHLMHYADDEDIRARDQDYAKHQMASAAWYEIQLRALLDVQGRP